MIINSYSKNTNSSDTSPLRRKHRDYTKLRVQLEQWLSKKLPELRDLRIGEITAPDSSGVANETLFIETRSDRGLGLELVLRLEGDEFLYPEPDLALHYEMYSRLGSMNSVPVPEMLGFEDKLSILGTRFMVMHRVPGRPVPDRPNFNYVGWLHDMSLDDRETVWREAVTAMSKLHQVDVTKFPKLQSRKADANGLVSCLRYWRRYARWCHGSEHALIHAAEDWLDANLPRTDDFQECLSWGDARMQNLMFDNTQCTALLDWDMVSLAGAEADLAWWAIADHKYTASRGLPRLAGIGSPQATIDLWESLTGRKVKHMDWHLVFAAFRQALISIRLMRLAEQAGKKVTVIPSEPSVGLQWLAGLLDLPLGQAITLPFVGLEH
jgi:aminoglycoside phosphotransferase (APT) family kinase protein